MGRRGPAKTPANIVKMGGNPGKRPFNQNEPEFSQDTVSVPDTVAKDEIALAEWNRRAPELLELGLLSGQFQTEFADYCVQHSMHVRLWQLITEVGVEQAIAKRFMKAFQTASQQRLRLAAKFGFNPADSTGIKVKPNRPDPLDIYFQI